MSVTIDFSSDDDDDWATIVVPDGPRCAECGKPCGYRAGGKPRKFCQKEPHEVKSKCTIKNNSRTWNAGRKQTPEQHRKLQKRYYYKMKGNPEKYALHLARSGRNRRRSKRRDRAAAPGAGARLMKKFQALIPKYLDLDTRQEALSELALLYAEGEHLQPAVREALKRAHADLRRRTFQNLPIEKITWL